jgi:hypothetical protein
MNKITRVTVLVICLLLAVVFYLRGGAVGGGIFILIGFIFEGLFWFGLLKKRN